MNAMLICGSRNPDGQTAQTADAVLRGLVKAGCSVEKVFLPTLKIEHCRQCEDNGWGLCRKEGRCVIDDDLLHQPGEGHGHVWSRRGGRDPCPTAESLGEAAGA